MTTPELFFAISGAAFLLAITLFIFALCRVSSLADDWAAKELARKKRGDEVEIISDPIPGKD